MIDAVSNLHVCPRCGDFHDALDDYTGWCEACAEKWWRGQPRKRVVEATCSACGAAYDRADWWVVSEQRWRGDARCQACVAARRRELREARMAS